MKFHLPAAILLALLALAGCAQQPLNGAAGTRPKLTPTVFSTIRGANYRGANAADTTDYWRHYSPAETQRDLSYAERVKLNQLRVFVNEASWLADKNAFRKNVLDLLRACEARHIGVMITIGDTASFIDTEGTGAVNRDRIRAFITDLANTISNEPALAFWDASNEPDYNAAGTPADRQTKRFDIVRQIAAVLHEVDKKTPVTIGVAYERNMETLADSVDVLSFHN